MGTLVQSELSDFFVLVQTVPYGVSSRCLGVNCTGWAVEVLGPGELCRRADWRVAEGRSDGCIHGVKPGLGCA